MLNSFWEKFGQQPNKTQVHEFFDPTQFHNFLFILQVFHRKLKNAPSDIV